MSYVKHIRYWLIRYRAVMTVKHTILLDLNYFLLYATKYGHIWLDTKVLRHFCL